MDHAIVTGATGFIGIHLVEELLARGVYVTALCRRGSRNLDRLPMGVSILYDMGDLPVADVFFHLAWEEASGSGRGDAVLQANNVVLTLCALRAAVHSKARFVALGTVYEHLAPQILSSGRYSGSDYYILSKNNAHAMSSQLAYQLGADYFWCRICHPIGRYIKPEQLMAYTVSNLLRGESPSFGPAETSYDIVAVEDIAHGLYLVGKYGTRREYYIGSGEPRILRDYLLRAREILGISTPIRIGVRPDDGLRFQKGWFSNASINEDTGFVPRICFDKAVMNLKDWLMGTAENSLRAGWSDKQKR